MSVGPNQRSEGDRYLSGKVAVVTGASRGIGRAIALRLGQLGATLALAARDDTALRDVTAELAATGAGASRHVVDLRIHLAGPELIAGVVRQHGTVDVLVNNAGGSVPGGLTDLDDAAWEDALELKLLGGMRVARAAWPHLVASRGALINIVGAAGWTAEARGIIAATQCAGFYAMTKSMAALGLQEGVQVNAINPGPVWTDRLRSRLPALGIDSNLPEEEVLAAIAQKYNVRRIGRPEDIANLAAFILSPSGGLFHGALINFDGGAVKSL